MLQLPAQPFYLLIKDRCYLLSVQFGPCWHLLVWMQWHAKVFLVNNVFTCISDSWDLSWTCVYYVSTFLQHLCTSRECPQNILARFSARFSQNISIKMLFIHLFMKVFFFFHFLNVTACFRTFKEHSKAPFPWCLQNDKSIMFPNYVCIKKQFETFLNLDVLNIQRA